MKTRGSQASGGRKHLWQSAAHAAMGQPLQQEEEQHMQWQKRFEGAVEGQRASARLKCRLAAWLLSPILHRVSCASQTGRVEHRRRSSRFAPPKIAPLHLATLTTPIPTDAAATKGAAAEAAERPSGARALEGRRAARERRVERPSWLRDVWNSWTATAPTLHHWVESSCDCCRLLLDRRLPLLLLPQLQR